MAVLVDGNEIVLSGTVGDLFWEDCFTASDVSAALAQVGRDQDVTIRLNSGGGIASEGAAIHAAIAAHKGRKTIIVEGIAASAASALAMAGDEVVMTLGSVMMIHDPSGLTFGTVADHELTIKALEALATSMAGIYADKSGKSVEEARADMRAEVWMTPEQAVEQGYADRVQGRAQNDNEPPAEIQPAAFDYRVFAHAPERLVALAQQNGWVNRPTARAASAASTRQMKEPSMANQNQADRAPAETNEAQRQAEIETARREAATAALTDGKARIKAILDSDEAKGREEQARYFAFDTDMAAEQAIAALSKAPKATEATAAAPNRFEAAMNRAGNPDVGADQGTVNQDSPEAAAAQILSLFRGPAKRSA